MKKSLIIFVLLAIAGMTTLSYHWVHQDRVAYRRGESSFAAGDYGRAIRYLAPLQEKGFREKGVALHLGMAYLAVGDVPKALPLYEKQVAQEPGDPFSVHALAGLYTRAGRFDEAIGLYRRLLLVRPQDPSVRIFLARALAGAGRFEEAVGQYRRALGDEP